MTRFLANWEVETDIIIPKGVPFVRYDHPNGTYTVFLRNVPETRNELTFLSMQLIFDAPALIEAKEIAQKLAKEFLDFVTVTSNLKLRLRRLFQIFNWEKSVTGMREAFYYSPSYKHDGAPYEALESGLLGTVALLQKQQVSPRLRRALKWFANGIASHTPDDQFAFFWFVIELVAQLVKDASPVPDRCPKCHGPLYCDACGISPLHRPYPKQAIKQVFEKYGPQDKDFLYGKASEARNKLMHGDEVDSIESTLDIDFGSLVNNMGRLAWVAILNQFVPGMLGTSPLFLEASHYVYMNVTGSAHVKIGFVPNFDNPDPKGFPNVEIKMVPREEKQKTNEIPKTA